MGVCWVGSLACLQSREEPWEHSAWQPGRKSQGTSQLPVVLLRPTDISGQTHTHHYLHTPPPRMQRLTTCQPWVHTGTEQSTSGILLLHCQPVLRCEKDRNPRSLRAHQPVPAQRENLPTSPPSLHMEMMAAGAAQGGLPLKARPAVASSRLTGITLGDLLIKDQRHPG